MAIFQYPQNDFDDPKKLLSLLGSFWSSSYQGNLLLQDLTSAAGQAAQQSYLNFLELVRSISRYDVPVFHRENWYAITVRESEFQEVRETEKYLTAYNPACPRSYAAGYDPYFVPDLASASYDKAEGLAYGRADIKANYAIPLPDSLAELKQIQSNVVNPASVLLKGIDFAVEDGLILFRDNIFEDRGWPKRELLNAAGEIVDRECTVWVYRGLWDWQVVYEQFGYAIGLQMKSSEAYKSFINAILDSFTQGTTVKTQQQAIAASFGIPFIVEPQEVVESVFNDSASLNIVTDKHVYKFPKRTQTTATVGKTLKAGDLLTDTLQVFEFNRGLNNQELSAITLDSGLLAYGFFSGITFENKTTPLQVVPNVNGYTKVSWELGGFDFDVKAFWDRVHAEGIARKQTLAHLLDVRENPTTEPTAASLPETINPLQFLVDNFFRNNAYVIRLKLNRNPNKLEFFPVEQFRKAQPPHTVLILIVELVHCDSPVIMEATGNAVSAGYLEAATGFPCMVTDNTINPNTSITERIRVGLIGGRCV